MLLGLPGGAAWPPAVLRWFLVVLIAAIGGHVAAQQGRTAYVINAVQQDTPANSTFKTMRAALASPQYDTILLTHDVSIWVSGLSLQCKQHALNLSGSFVAMEQQQQMCLAMRHALLRVV